MLLHVGRLLQCAAHERDMHTIFRIDPPLDDPFDDLPERRFTRLEGKLLMQLLDIEPIFPAGMIDGEDLLGRVLTALAFLPPLLEAEENQFESRLVVFTILLEVHAVAFCAYNLGVEVTWIQPDE